MLVIDGSQGEGGGQILRTSLSLAIVTRTPCRIEHIRAGRQRPGLQRQHLAAVEAAAMVSSAEVRGAALGSQELTFRPGETKPGEYEVSIGTAGSTTLVLETILPALLCAPGATTLRIDGGTHNPMAPPFDFLAAALLPLLRRMGARVEERLVRPGFYPAGGGRVEVKVLPAARLTPLLLRERGELRAVRGRAVVSQLPLSIAERELKTLAAELSLRRDALRAEEVPEPRGPGNFVAVEVECTELTEVFSAIGERGVLAEAVAARAAREAREYIASGAAVGPYLADQLLLPLALAGGGEILTMPLTLHARTNLDVIGRFLAIETRIEPCAAGLVRVALGRRA